MNLPSLICLILGISLASANVEKTIFLGPEPVNIPEQQPSLLSLNLDTLTPENWSLRTHIEAIFPTEDFARGKSTWLILDNLTESQRYEVRICWLATQPTAFHLETYTLPTVFDTPELITSLYNYSMSRQLADPPPPPPASAKGGGEHLSSVLFLRIDAAADYFTTDAALMQWPEPVLADVILDPFVLNVLPRTLLPTVGYVVLVAAASWALATRLIMPWVRGLMVEGGDGRAGAGREAGEEKKTR
ncbi:hypothetical protein J7T55_005985 [Diaporthe amygdali]|uniref:uncharacterized protein n=1 Tax=Phomopsis amygdali TaxID=1214568 RepID=UPI0022FEC721|nr:uncharacterized protein J7T55_005985 [Diaporthe amygdali]KAJ0124645.1 hypothetical protein J7T55_005985 [Diaporthe amygdali]